MVLKYIYNNKEHYEIEMQRIKTKKAIFQGKNYSKMKNSYEQIKKLYFHQEKTDPLQC